MENPKRCIHEDLLRDLPDCLLFDIFWRLPMTDVVRTSVLSKRWRNFWTTAPFLNFDNRAMLLGDGSKLQNFVNQALSCWNGDRVLKFRFHSYHEIASSMYSDVDLWVNFAQRNGVEELHLHVLCITKRAWPGFDVLDSVPFGLGHFLQIWLSHALSQILQSIQHAENIALSDCCTEVVGALKMNCVHSAFLNVKSLELRCCFDDYKQVVGVLAMFPRLEKLIIRDKKEEGLQDDTEPLKFEANIPESFLLQLRTIEVTWSERYDIFPLIEILLKYASKLEKIVFQLYEIKSPAPSNSLSLVSQKLKGMQRSSTNCTINITQLRI
ncbi:putative F-box/LRR-repeat protein At5g02930 isoform X11 [Salvia hispanica]|uniref:putative F-box/LRR-repeat protein At5g02930 isoform X11 n=1 Tax=Salvia hispanica TaxID=49212 RepID=UPI0020090217|nr:putative F-box/LRR-repeat protein At5g02930 isoform X11 [Salvia hispanica]